MTVLVYDIKFKSKLFMNGFDYEYHKKNKINNNTKLKLNDKKLNIILLIHI